MKTFSTKPLGLALVMAALFLSVSSRAYGYVISVYPDSVTMTTAVGTSTDAYIYISDGRDTSNGSQTPGTVFVSLSGSSQFTMLTDSVLQFVGETVIRVRYSPTSTAGSWAKLTIVGDSNTEEAAVVGNPLSHFAPQITTANYDSIPRNQQYCRNFGVENTNADTIWVTQVLLTQKGTQWSIENLASLPIAIPGHSSLTLGQLCAYLAASDSQSISGILKIVYTYGSGTDSVTTGLEGFGNPVNSSCVTPTGSDDFEAAEGASVTKTFMLTNTTDSSVYLDSPQIAGTDNAQFTVNSPSFPLVLPMDSSVTLSVTFTAPSPSAKDNYYATFEATVYGMSPDDVACDPLTVQLWGSVVIPVVDSITLDVPPDSSTLSITARTTKSRHAIFIHNAGTSPLLIESLLIDDSSSFAFFGTLGTDYINVYDSLAAGATMGPIYLTLEAPDTGTYDISLTLNYVVQQAHQKGAVPTSASQIYSVIAHRLPPVSETVSEPNAPATTDFALMPNPARDEVTVVLPENGASTVEIYDVLGNLIMSRVAQGAFVWNATSNTGVLANGTYIVRVSQGNHTSSKRLVIVR